METKPLSIFECLLSILLTEEIVAFVLRTGTHAIKTLVRLYCAKLFCLYSLPLKRLAIAPPGDFQVRVLLTELYPDCYTRRGAACRSNEDLLIEDYLIYLQKFGFDDPEEAQIDEMNIMFQANHLPLSVFQSNGQNHDRDFSVCPALPTPTTSKNCSCIKTEPFDLDQNPTRVIVTADQEQDDILLSSTHHEDDSRVTNLDTESSENIDTFDHSMIFPSKKSAKPLTNGGNIVGGSHSSYLDSPPAQSNRNGLSCKYNNRIHRMYAGPISDPTSLSRSPHYPSQNVLKSLSNVRSSSQSSCTPVVPQPKIVKLGYVWPRYDKPRVRVLSQDCTSSSDSHSSDNSRDNSVWDRTILEKDSTGLADLFEDSDSEGTLKEEEEEQEEEVEEYDDKYKYYSALKSSPSTSSGSYPKFSRTSDRNIRDVNILKSLGVPFSYDEVAYSSNELFREMKSRPCLSFEQISAMLDARRRATNRAAADRCRRMKSQARNSLATKLGRLRLRSTHLNRRMINTRKTRQWKRDRVSAIERGLIRMLTDDKGIPLDPSKWRIHLTANGDVVIMNLESSPVQFGNDRTVNFFKVEPVSS